MNYKLYETGGRIRDRFLGLKSKDVDYSVVIEGRDEYPIGEVFGNFVEQIKSEGYTVFVETSDCFTVRAKFPKGHVHEGLDADFVLARKELEYEKGTRRPKVVLGSLKDDLERRDFTVNAMAEDIEGNITDLFNGQKDLQNRILRTPGDTAVSFNNDPLRIIRALRFAVTKGFDWSDEIWECLSTFDASKMKVVSVERIREELFKSFSFSTPLTLQLLNGISLTNYPLYRAILPDEIKLLPTLKK